MDTVYRVDRKEEHVTISGPNGRIVYTTSQDAFIVFKDGDGLTVKRVQDLNDADLVLALAKAVRILTDTGIAV